jgi:dTDP-4-amino-4,6-dideoxygalactose transaminase
MHVQQCFAYLGHKTGDFPSSEAAAKETLALPIYPELLEAQLRYVVDCIREFSTIENLNLEAAQTASSGSFKQSN